MLAQPAHALALDGTVTLPVPHWDSTSEPYIAINPANPQDQVVVAHDEVVRQESNKIRAWTTFDGGASWTANSIFDGRFEGRVANSSDPVATFSPIGGATVANIALKHGSRSWQSLVVMQSSADGGPTFPDVSVPVRTRHGRPVPVDFGDIRPRQSWNDKEWIASDQTGGPYRGSIYLAWDEIKGLGSTLFFARDPSGGGTFTTPQLIEADSMAAQIGVRSDGTVDLVWSKFNPHDSKRYEIRHAASTDGGASFGAPQTIAELRNAGADPLTTLAIDASGRLLVCWSQVFFTARVPRMSCTASSDGVVWSAVTPVDPEAPRNVAQVLPAVTSQNNRFWLSAYLEAKKTTRVVLYRSDDGTTFTEHATLASRRYGFGQGDFVGDYDGLAATADHVIAAYVLSRSDNFFALQRVYVTSLATP